jgi:hypothetical protein
MLPLTLKDLVGGWKTANLLQPFKDCTGSCMNPHIPFTSLYNSSNRGIPLPVLTDFGKQ